MKIHLDKVERLVGFAMENAKPEESSKVLICALLTSDDQNFYKYLDHISSSFLNKNQIPIDSVYRFLLIIHRDDSADLYVNDFEMEVEVLTKRDLNPGIVTLDDIADIRKVKFPTIPILESDSVICCIKVGWRFGLFFDLAPSLLSYKPTEPVLRQKLDIEQTQKSIGKLYRDLSFYHIYKVLESDAQFMEMMSDGWFPFVEILAGVYKELSEVYQNRFNFEERINNIVDGFGKEQIGRITEKWWKKQIFLDKKSLIEAGLNAYLQNNRDGFVNSIKNLWTEVEGILRILYFSETGKGDRVTSKDIMDHIITKAKVKCGSDHSLFLPVHFLTYLQNVVFASFNVETGQVSMSRNSSSHGVADAQQYTKARALQLILVLDQIYFYL